MQILSLRTAALAALVLVSHVGWSRPSEAVPAFPGAEGFGADTTTGGRGGTVYRVTSLADSGKGTLRECAEASGARTCVFTIGGYIDLSSPIEVQNPNLTIAGQTAPGGGITVKTSKYCDALFQIKTNNVILRYLRFRNGYTSGGACTTGDDTDAQNIEIARGADHVIVDHVSTSWATDESIILWYDSKDITLQYVLDGEAIGAGKGPNIGSSGADRRSFHHNMLVSNLQRNPRLRHDGLLDMVNNVVYNSGPGDWGGIKICGGSGTKVNFVNNYWKHGPSTDASFLASATSDCALVYLSGNETTSGDWWSPSQDEYVVDTPFPAPPVTVTSPKQAYEDLTAEGGAGASKALSCDGTLTNRRDGVDARLVADVLNGTGSLADRKTTDELGGYPALEPGTPCIDTDRDGMPDAFETILGSDPAVDDANGDLDEDGYTNLEEYLNGTAAPDGEPPARPEPPFLLDS